MSGLTRIQAIIIGVCVVYGVFVVSYDYHARGIARDKIEQHASVITDALWNFNPRGAEEYLRLAATSRHYRTLTVFDEKGDLFQAIESVRPPLAERILIKLRLIPEVTLSSPVRYHGRVIGSVQAVWLPRTIYIHLCVLLALAMGTAILLLYMTVRREKQLLEERVELRTRELARANDRMLTEIGERKKTEAELRTSEEEYRALYEETKKAEEVYRSLIDSSADAIAIYSLDKKIESVSTAFTRLFGWSQQEATGKTLPGVPATERTQTDLLFAALITQGAACLNFETRRTRRDGGEVEVSLSASRFNDHLGRPTGILVVFRDISERKRLEEQLQHADRMEAIGSLAGGVAHDFNNLMMGIQGSVDLFLARQDPATPGLDRLRQIDGYIDNAKTLTRQLLGFARGGKYEIKTTDLNDLIRAENEMFGRTRKELTLTADLAGDLKSVAVDRGQIRQVLLNLYLNAWQAMADGGTITIRTENAVLGEATTTPFGLPAGPYVKLSVTDTGTGMDNKTRRQIFNPFFTTKGTGRGTGLGLASVYGIIKNHNGIIDVYSELGAGTTFTVYLPVSDGVIEPERKRSEVRVPGAGTVLLVDDEEMILSVGEEMLKLIGYRVLAARSGAEAVALFERHHQDIDVVLLDMIMPELSGSEVFDLLQEVDSGVPVVLSSGYSLDGRAAAIIDRGCRGFLQKPFDVNELSVKLREVVKQPVASS